MELAGADVSFPFSAGVTATSSVTVLAVPGLGGRAGLSWAFDLAGKSGGELDPAKSSGSKSLEGRSSLTDPLRSNGVTFAVLMFTLILVVLVR